MSCQRKASKRTGEAAGFVSRRHETRPRLGHRYFIPGPRTHKLPNGHSAGLDVLTPGLSEDVQAIEARLQSLTEDELLARYHDLVDQRFEQPLNYTERFELERIEARLDYQDKDELERTAAIRGAWEQERSDLLASLERLLAGFRTAR